MKKGKPLTKNLRFVVRLNPQSLPCMKRPETFLQLAQDVFIHGMTAFKTGSIFRRASR